MFCPRSSDISQFFTHFVTLQLPREHTNSCSLLGAEFIEAHSSLRGTHSQLGELGHIVTVACPSLLHVTVPATRCMNVFVCPPSGQSNGSVGSFKCTGMCTVHWGVLTTLKESVIMVDSKAVTPGQKVDSILAPLAC